MGDARQVRYEGERERHAKKAYQEQTLPPAEQGRCRALRFLSPPVSME